MWSVGIVSNLENPDQFYVQEHDVFEEFIENRLKSAWLVSGTLAQTRGSVLAGQGYSSGCLPHAAVYRQNTS